MLVTNRDKTLSCFQNGSGYLLNELRKGNLFCDAYLVGDDNVRVPVHKVILAVKACAILFTFNKENEPLDVVFSKNLEEQLMDNSTTKPVLNVKGYTHNVLETFVELLYTGDLKEFCAEDLMMQLCFFLLHVYKLLNVNDEYALRCLDSLHLNMKTYLDTCKKHDGGGKLLEKMQSSVRKVGATLSCHLCKKKFSSKSLLCYHLRIHFKLKSMKKKISQKSFTNSNPKTSTDSRTFVSDSNSEVKSGPSRTGRVSNRNGTNVKKHKTATSKFTCDHCSKSFTMLKRLRHHIERWHSIDSEINKPGHNTLEKSIASSHKKSCVGNQGHVCSKCGRTFATRGNLKRHHTIIHEGLKKFQCDICHSCFGQKVTLDLHLMSVHKAKNNYESFKKNGVPIPNAKGNLIFDADVMSSIRETADICTASNFYTNSFLEKPSDFDMSSFFITADLESDTLPGDGSDIGKENGDFLIDALTTINENQDDVLSEDDNARWKDMTTCKICNKQLSRPSNLKKHMLIHDAADEASSSSAYGNGSITSIINFTATSSAGTVHRSVDNSVDQIVNNTLTLSDGSGQNKKKKSDKDTAKKGSYVCHHCGKTYLLAEYLKKHVSVVHCITKGFPCSYCSKSFASVTRLKRHQIVHDKKMCSKCKQVFEGQRAYSNHLKTSCGNPGFLIQDDSPFFFGDAVYSNILLGDMNSVVPTYPAK